MWEDVQVSAPESIAAAPQHNNNAQQAVQAASVPAEGATPNVEENTISDGHVLPETLYASHDLERNTLLMPIDTVNNPSYDVWRHLGMLLNSSQLRDLIIMRNNNYQHQDKTNLRLERQIQKLQADVDALRGSKPKSTTERWDYSFVEQDMEIDQLT